MYIDKLGIEIPQDIDDDVVEEALMGILAGEWTTEDTMLIGSRITTFQQGGVMTRSKGIVITLPGGCEFQLAIVQSR